MGTDFFQYAISGLTIGAIYAMVAIGYNAIYNVTEIINFAQGEFVMMGGLFAVFFAGSLHFPLYAAFLCAVCLTGCIGLAMDRFIIGRARDTSVLSLTVITLALSIMLKGGAMLWWGKDPYSLPAFSSGGPIRIGSAAIQPQALWIIGICALIIIALTLFFRKSIYGQAMLACANNPSAARLAGIPVGPMILLSFVLSAVDRGRGRRSSSRPFR